MYLPDGKILGHNMQCKIIITLIVKSFIILKLDLTKNKYENQNCLFIRNWKRFPIPDFMLFYTIHSASLWVNFV